MAALADYGSPQIVQMHPFFRTTQHEPTSTNLQPAHGPPSVDGSLNAHAANDNALVHHDSHDERDPTSSRPDAWSEAPKHVSAWIRGDTTVSGPIDDDHSMEEYQRRKRRRVTEEQKETSQADTTFVLEHQPWQEQLSYAACSLDEQSDPAGAQSSPDPTGHPIPILTTSSSECRDRNLTNRSQFRGLSSPDAEQVAIDLSSLPTHPIDTPSEPPDLDTTPDDISLYGESKMATPKKRVVRLSGTGRLTNSPKRSPKSLKPAGKKSDQRSTSRSTNVKMKNGKLVSSLRISLKYSSAACGRQIDDILSTQPRHQVKVQSDLGDKGVRGNATSAVHPFFLGKPSAKMKNASALTNEATSTAPASEDEALGSLKPKKPWKDIIFGSKKNSQRFTSGLDPIWPPNDLHHVQPVDDVSLIPTASTLAASKLKSKHAIPRVEPDEDVLQMFGTKLSNELHNRTEAICLPTRAVMSGRALLGSLSSTPGVTGLDSRILSCRSAFDRGMASGPHMWAQEYAPKCWQDILQPKAQILYEWLVNLQVHNVQSGQMQPKPKESIQKKRRKRKSDEMDDFIAASDDDASNPPHQLTRNAILLTGPSGCGKTASVYATAAQLGFEVFEIHPGMRRNAKDILDKVGDMTQNHLVQQATGLSSRRSSISMSDTEVISKLPAAPPADQQIMTAFMGKGLERKKPILSQNKETRDVKGKSQKQSLILFEEVDTVFDEDKGFWSAVQALIKTSKRPVVLTCNDPGSLPLDELDLYTTLEYVPPSADVAASYLQHVAAAEGHLLDIGSVRNLYLGKRCDLRASLTQLNLWCQMTVGSVQGGLDWMMPYNENKAATPGGSVTRIVSKDTYTNGCDLLPGTNYDSEDMIRFAKDNLAVDVTDWVSDDLQSKTEATGLHELDDLVSLCEARSFLDLADDSVSATLAGQIKGLSTSLTQPCSRETLVDLYLSSKPQRLSPTDVTETMYPLTEELRIGIPQPPGRKAPSLDTASTSVVTDIAPYVRFIVGHDQRLEILRNELGGGSQSSSNKRQRRTRASRAALEGGTKSGTRRDKWFPEALDFQAVLATGGVWPQAEVLLTQESMRDSGSIGVESPASSMETG